MDRKEDGLKALGAKTQYKMDYAPEVLETFVNSIRAMTTGYVSTALSSHRFVLSRGSLTLRRFASATSLA